ncbi:MAG: hypothetical protein HN341_14765 [Verrucomicrobia bacterium]|nr:hypothetical protein [Verrucomicrobiota bacterium]
MTREYYGIEETYRLLAGLVWMYANTEGADGKADGLIKSKRLRDIVGKMRNGYKEIREADRELRDALTSAECGMCGGKMIDTCSDREFLRHCLEWARKNKLLPPSLQKTLLNLGLLCTECGLRA